MSLLGRVRLRPGATTPETATLCRAVAAARTPGDAPIHGDQSDDRDVSDAVLLSSCRPERLLAAAEGHGLDDALAAWISDVHPEHVALAPLLRRVGDDARRHLRSLADLRCAAKAFTSAGVRFVVLKGPVLAAMRPGPHVRRYSDLDLLVDPASFPAAIDALMTAGARPVSDTAWQRCLDTRHAEVPVVLPLGTLLDLHWDLCPAHRVRRRLRVDRAAALLGRTAVLDLGAVEVPVLAPLDMLLHTAIHSTWSGGERLAWSADLWDVFRATAPDAAAVTAAAALARSWKVTPLVADALRRLVGVAGEAVPDAVPELLRALGGDAWSRGVWAMSGGAVETGGAVALLRLCMRGDVRASSTEVCARGLASARYRLGAQRDPIGRATSRADYLAFVRRHATAAEGTSADVARVARDDLRA